jgi:hypothetical protein
MILLPLFNDIPKEVNFQATLIIAFAKSFCLSCPFSPAGEKNSRRLRKTPRLSTWPGWGEGVRDSRQWLSYETIIPKSRQPGAPATIGGRTRISALITGPTLAAGKPSKSRHLGPHSPQITLLPVPLAKNLQGIFSHASHASTTGKTGCVIMAPASRPGL